MMKIKFNRGNAYFDTYHIHNGNGQTVGIIEDHNRGVKQQYFVGWKLDTPSKMSGHLTGETKSFYTKEEAMIFSIGEIITA